MNNGLLFLTHSDRVTMLISCSRDHFRRRFGKPDRLSNPPPFKTLKPMPIHKHGAVSIFRIEDGRITPHAVLKHPQRIQCVLQIRPDTLVIGLEDHLQIQRYGGDLYQLSPKEAALPLAVDRIDLASVRGIRTLDRHDLRRLWVSCSPADSAFLIDIDTGQIERQLRMPEALYGSNWDLTGVDLRDHYVPNNYQTTHLNGAGFHQGRLAVSTLIQGAVGVFDLESGAYRELARGFEGCHGARFTLDGRLYFSDSCSGSLIFLDDEGRETGRFQAPSKWLHDTVQVGPDHFAFAMGDRNAVAIYQISTGEKIFEKRFLTAPNPLLVPLFRLFPGWIGNSLQFLTFSAAS